MPTGGRRGSGTGRRPPNSVWRRCETPPRMEAIRRRGQPIASSISGKGRGRSGSLGEPVEQLAHQVAAAIVEARDLARHRSSRSAARARRGVNRRGSASTRPRRSAGNLRSRRSSAPAPRRDRRLARHSAPRSARGGLDRGDVGEHDLPEQPPLASTRPAADASPEAVAAHRVSTARGCRGRGPAIDGGRRARLLADRRRLVEVPLGRRPVAAAAAASLEAGQRRGSMQSSKRGEGLAAEHPTGSSSTAAQLRRTSSGPGGGRFHIAHVEQVRRRCRAPSPSRPAPRRCAPCPRSGARPSRTGTSMVVIGHARAGPRTRAGLRGSVRAARRVVAGPLGDACRSPR